MAEFYITFDRDDHHYLAIVTAHDRPDSLQFTSYLAVVETMESLGQEWLLHSEIEVPDDGPTISAAWLENMAERGRLRQLPKPHGAHVTGDFAGGAHTG
jgi:hypothetical protein